MDLLLLFKILWRRKFIILAVSLAAAALTYYMVGKQAPVYKSTATLSTGIMNLGMPSVGSNNSYIQPYKIEHSFNNLIELLKSRAIMGLLSNKLAIRDLKSDVAFNKAGKKAVKAKYGDDLSGILNLFETGDIVKEVDIPANSAKGERAAKKADVLKMLGYDYSDINWKFQIIRVPNTDFVDISFESDDAEFSSFAVNNLSDVFIDYYLTTENQDKNSSNRYLDNMVAQRKRDLEEKQNRLKDYKMQNDVINIEIQTKGLSSQIKALEAKRQEEYRKIPSLENTIKNIDKHMDETSAEYSDLQVRNRKIETLRSQIAELDRAFIDGGGKDDALLAKKNRLRRDLEAIVSASATQAAPNVNSNIENLRAQRRQAEIELDIAKSNAQNMDIELAELKANLRSIASKEITFDELQRELQIEKQEYIDVVEKVGRSQVDKDLILGQTQMKVMEYGFPAAYPKNKNRKMMAGFAGLVGLALSSVLMLFFAFIDVAINSPRRFQQFTQMPLLETINKINPKKVDLANLFITNQGGKKLEIFKQQLRKIRHQIENTNKQVFLVSSIQEKEGKTFFILNMAYALSLNNKKVLIIDTNFRNNSLSQIQAGETANYSSENIQLIGENELTQDFVSTGVMYEKNGSGVDTICCQSTNRSPAEVLAGKNFNNLLTNLKTKYDCIFLEGAALNNYADTRELAGFADTIIAVVSADTVINEKSKASLDYLKALDGKFLGAILNKVQLHNLE